ncbi:Sulfite reductase [NADPH] subunit beta [Marasmius tenuissimus]|uniref:Sulfite reductase [NADPH] subunit beta n=1 Tax=Marasmius tenuissimus TaxID=585030 RepID=A0ABR2ZIT7_9AGAR
MGTFFRTWDLPWERGSYEHLTLKRNAGSDTVKKNSSLPLLWFEYVSIDAVARIAFIASDTLIHTLQPNSTTSLYSSVFDNVAKTSKRTPGILPVSHLADPAAAIKRASSGSALVSFTSLASSQSITRLVLASSDLSSLPLVLHVAVQGDLSDALLLRAVGPFFLLSTNPQQAHDNALLASKLARTEKKAVIHVFYSDSSSHDLPEVPEEGILSFLYEEKAQDANGIVNGHENDDEAHDDDPTLKALSKAYEHASLATVALVRRPIRPFITTSPSEPHTVVFLLGQSNIDITVDGVAFSSISLLSPLLPSRILHEIPSTVSRVIVLEQASRWSMKWLPLYLDIVSTLQKIEPTARPSDAASAPASTRLTLGSTSSSPASPHAEPHVPKHEASYTKILSHLFQDRLEISNSPSLVATQGEIATTPEYALGRVRGQLGQRDELIAAVRELLQVPDLPANLHSLLSKWVLAKDHATKSRTYGDDIVRSLAASPVAHPAASKIISLQVHLPSYSRWIIGSDTWSYDIGSSGLHHAIASGLNVNILIIDTIPYTARNSGDSSRRKHDVGLYAMNHGDVFVASVAVYSSYAQVLQAVMEADAYDGPSVETKLAVDTGYWPLYRWDPSKERAGKEPFSLDSDSVKNDLQQFLNRQNHLSQLVYSKPELATELVSSLGENVKEARRKKATQSYNELLNAQMLPQSQSCTPPTVVRLKRWPRRWPTVPNEEHVVFITSTAGQGEPPQNGRQFFKAINAAAARGDTLFPNLKYTVFGMGDSKYWPRPEDAHYYNKPGKDLDARLEKLGGERVIPLALGDDQDADGTQTGYNAWEPQLWKLLGVDTVEVTEKEPDPITNEHIKAASNYLRGTIAEGLSDTSTGALAPSDTQLTKFHGIYQQDDRDIRDERLAQGVEPAFAFMIRVRMPGGVCKPDQWLQMDQIADEHGSGTFKITTRQTFQFHGVIKRHLKPAIQDINRVLLDTLAACGDVNRNVICSSIPSLSTLHEQVYQFCVEVSNHLIPRTSAYHEIWLDKKMVAGEALKNVEPIYGEFYLPRKPSHPPTTWTSSPTISASFAIIDDDGKLAGFNVAIGGGMGVTFGNKKTYPRTADVIGFCTPEEGKHVAQAVVLTQRDNGNRAETPVSSTLLTEWDWTSFKAEVEKRLGYEIKPARSYTFDRNVDDFGWVTGENGKHHFTMFIENGRIQDEPGKDFKTGLREIAKVHTGNFRLTANQHLVVSDVVDENLSEIKEILAKYKMDNLSQTGLRLSSSACVAFPTCGLANAESERYLPILVDKVEKICEENGLRNDSIVMRMTGCPNGCARPYVAEIAFVGKAPGQYLMLLGGGFYGQRVNKIYRESVTEPEILAILRPMIKRYALERHEGEHFGDWTIRAGYIAETKAGKEYYDRMGGEEQFLTKA